MANAKRVGEWELVAAKDAGGWKFYAEHVFSGHVVGRGWTAGTKAEAIAEARSSLAVWHKSHGLEMGA